jgi:hypothetical protein
MWKCLGNVGTICGLAAAAIMVACPARAEDVYCHGAIPVLDFGDPDHSETPVLLLGHVTSSTPPVEDSSTHGCPSRAPVCAKSGDLEPGHRVILSGRHDAFVCATYIDVKGVDRSDWLPADAVAFDKAEPVALADWLGHWRHSDKAHDGRQYKEGDITAKAGKAGALQIEGTANTWDKGRAAAYPAAMKSDVTPAGDRVNFTTNGDKDWAGCKVQMQRFGPWLIVGDDQSCGGGDLENATFNGVYTHIPSAGVGEAAVPGEGVTPIGFLD